MIYPDGLSNLKLVFVPTSNKSTSIKVTIDCYPEHPNFKQNHRLAEHIIDEVTKYIENGDYFVKIDKVVQRAILDLDLG